MPPHDRLRGHIRISTALFAGLGGQVGAWAVLVPELTASRRLSAGELGAALGLMAAASIVTLAGGGALVDRVGRRPLAVAGAGGMAAALLVLAVVESRAALAPTLILYGAANGLLDLAANTIGSDVEREHRRRVMIRLHAGFSGAATAGALLAAGGLALGAGHAALYALTGACLAALAAAATLAPLPRHQPSGAPDSPGRGAGGGAADGAPGPAADRSGRVRFGRGARSGAPGRPGRVRFGRGARSGAPDRPGRVRFGRGVAVATALCGLCFLGDGVLEGYGALYLRGLASSGVLIAGAGIAAFHAASLGGRLVSARLVERLGERRLMALAGGGAAAGTAVMVLATWAPLAAAGLLVVGASLAPVIPTALSVAGRSSPGRSGAAVSLATTVGYGAFVAGPPLAGALADATSLRTALVPIVVTTGSLAVVGRAIPRGGHD